MRGYGTHGQPAGTFSDDSSLAFCLAEVPTTTFDMDKIARKFISWLRDGYWTAWGSVFDVGMSTRNAIARLEAQAADRIQREVSARMKTETGR